MTSSPSALQAELAQAGDLRVVSAATVSRLERELENARKHHGDVVAEHERLLALARETGEEFTVTLRIGGVGGGGGDRAACLARAKEEGKIPSDAQVVRWEEPCVAGDPRTGNWGGTIRLHYVLSKK